MTEDVAILKIKNGSITQRRLLDIDEHSGTELGIMVHDSFPRERSLKLYVPVPAEDLVEVFPTQKVIREAEKLPDMSLV